MKRGRRDCCCCGGGGCSKASRAADPGGGRRGQRERAGAAVVPGRTFAAASRGDTVILLYVRPPPPTYSVLDASGYLFAEEVTAAMERYSREVADAVVEKAQKLCTLYTKEELDDESGEHEMKVEVKVAVGDARAVIYQVADKLGADVLVMGSHGYGFFKRALLGSVSDYCLRNASCPVLIVKP